MEHLEQSETALNRTLNLHQKYYSDSVQGFKEATMTIARIRANFDAIYNNIRLLKERNKTPTPPVIPATTPLIPD